MLHPVLNFAFSSNWLSQFFGILKRWTGSSWVKAKLKSYDGTSFVTKPVRYWDGLEWKLIDVSG